MDVQKYVVTLGMRPAEMSGLGELPGATKDMLTPVLLLAPWLTSKTLSKALEKFEKSYPKRNYFVDMDHNYEPSEVPSDAKEQWRSLVTTPTNIGYWWSLLEDYEHANPCLLMNGRTVESARDQIEWARDHNRAFCVRLNIDSNNFGIPDWAYEVIDDLRREGSVDYAVIFDFQLVPQKFDIDGSNLSHIGSFISGIRNEVPIIISFTSFPTSFSIYDGLSICKFNNRQVVRKVQLHTNRPITYGDWGSTRPRKKGFGRAKVRVDFPLEDSWLISRKQEDELTYREAAQLVVNSDSWQQSPRLGIWGEQLIEGAARGASNSIGSITRMIAARINIHLHRQAFYGQKDFPTPSQLDEGWSDDLE